MACFLILLSPLPQPKPCALRSLLVARAMETSPTGHGDFALAIVGLSLRVLRTAHVGIGAFLEVMPVRLA